MEHPGPFKVDNIVNEGLVQVRENCCYRYQLFEALTNRSSPTEDRLSLYCDFARRSYPQRHFRTIFKNLHCIKESLSIRCQLNNPLVCLHCQCFTFV
ncbi:hypothetical protein J6590_027457 [Homalodisca vitripennis]|nr:hypothetical protein J6590_027457 [Homalodisca vitripennis]